MKNKLNRFRSDEHSTLSILLKKYNNEKLIKLEIVCEDYFGLNYETAKKRANEHSLPFVAFRLGESQKQPLMIDICDLAHHIDKATVQANKEWDKFQ